ncbi:MAG: Crp/Fnr family transcriptional regulator [Pseudolabrys sp.]
MLASLAKDDLAALRPHLRPINLRQGDVLHDVGATMQRAYFVDTGIISLVVPLKSGQMIEIGMVGRDGVAGGSAALDGKLSLNKAIVQIAGAGSWIAVARLRRLADAGPAFRTAIIRHEQLILVQAQQSAACNASHSVEARLARWLLRSRDLLGAENLTFTQEFLSQMLGVRRSSVSTVAHTLQAAGLIRYKRGHIHIIDLDGLRAASCECYGAVKAQSKKLLGKASA